MIFMKCRMCGYEFDENEIPNRGCSGCGKHGCHSVHCPNCGFGNSPELAQEFDFIIKLKDKINFTVPTGNFGNILAAYYAKLMGLPVNKLICTSNDNNVLYDFFNSGIYNKNRELILTSSPSMDILISSN